MAQWLRAVTALAKDMGLVPSTHILAHTVSNSGFIRLNALFWLPQALHIHNVTKRSMLYKNTEEEKGLLSGFPQPINPASICSAMCQTINSTRAGPSTPHLPMYPRLYQEAWLAWHLLRKCVGELGTFACYPALAPTLDGTCSVTIWNRSQLSVPPGGLAPGKGGGGFICTS